MKEKGKERGGFFKAKFQLSNNNCKSLRKVTRLQIYDLKF